jgi:hypothetical protein
MKKTLFIALALMACAGLFAQITPYGSVRMADWYNINNEYKMPNTDPTKDGGRITNDFLLQGNSRFGVNFKNDTGLTAKFEMSSGMSLRYLWAEQKFDGFSLLVGQTDDGMDSKGIANQVWGHDTALMGYGAAYGQRKPLVRFKMDNGFYISAMAPIKTGLDSGPTTASIDALIPKLNLGYDVDLGDIKIYPTATFQMYNYNADWNAADMDETVISFVAQVVGDFKLTNEFALKVGAHFGSNMAQMQGTSNGGWYGSMGADVAVPNAKWDAVNEEINDVATFGFFLNPTFKLTDEMTLGGGFGMTSHSGDHLGDDDITHMAFFANSAFKMYKLILTPELGMLMQNTQLDDVPSIFYFGTQLRYDF